MRNNFHYTFDADLRLTRLVNCESIKNFTGQHWNLDFQAFTAIKRAPLEPLEADWLIFAMAIYMADRFSSRRTLDKAPKVFWKRSICLQIPVSDPKRWTLAKNELLRALQFLTEDDWSIDFYDRRLRLNAESQFHLGYSLPLDSKWTALFSGGLDSLAGSLAHASESGEPGLLVSGWNNIRLHQAQLRLIDNLFATKSIKGSGLGLEYSLEPILDRNGMESSQRGRGWIHVSFGILCALLAGHRSLYVFENGIGSFNLPCFASQFGSQSSRAMHPIFLSRISSAAASIFQQQVSIQHPYVLSTKGEMLSSPSIGQRADTLGHSFSCELFPNYHEAIHQCGVCPSCLVRRASLSSATMPDNGMQYSWDVLKRGIPKSFSASSGLYRLESLNLRLRTAVCGQDCEFLNEFPSLEEDVDESASALSLKQDDFLSKFVALHRRWISEWDSFADQIPGLRGSLTISA